MPSEVLESSSGMEETVQKESKSGGQSPHRGSLRRAVATAVTFDGEATMDRRKKKKKESRPESIIVYRSENENKVEEEQADEEGGERSSEEGSKFLGQSMADGMYSWEHPLSVNIFLMPLCTEIKWKWLWDQPSLRLQARTTWVHTWKHSDKKHQRLFWAVSCSSLQRLVVATLLVLNVCAGSSWLRKMLNMF